MKDPAAPGATSFFSGETGAVFGCSWFGVLAGEFAGVLVGVVFALFSIMKNAFHVDGKHLPLCRYGDLKRQFKDVGSNLEDISRIYISLSRVIHSLCAALSCTHRIQQIGMTVIIQVHRVLTLTICLMFSTMLIAMFML
jgi:hypothetical protein